MMPIRIETDQLDRIDHRILRILSADGRISIADLARCVMTAAGRERRRREAETAAAEAATLDPNSLPPAVPVNPPPTDADDTTSSTDDAADTSTTDASEAAADLAADDLAVAREGRCHRHAGLGAVAVVFDQAAEQYRVAALHRHAALDLALLDARVV